MKADAIPPKFRIVAFGEALVDRLPTGPVVGGAPLNFAIRCAELARPLDGMSALITRIGADEEGERILGLLRDRGVETSAVQVDPRRPTGWVDVSVVDGQPEYTIAENVAWDFIADEENGVRLAAQADVLYFGTLAQRNATGAAALRRLVDVAGQACKLLDLNLRRPYPTKECIEESLQVADVLKCNEEELAWLANSFGWTVSGQGSDGGAETAERLQHTFRLASVFWTRGDQGCVWQHGSDRVTGEVPRITAEPDADTVGAGDAAAAALAVGIANQWEYQRVVDLANWCGAYVASRRGATAPLPADLLDQQLRR